MAVTTSMVSGRPRETALQNSQTVPFLGLDAAEHGPILLSVLLGHAVTEDEGNK